MLYPGNVLSTHHFLELGGLPHRDLALPRLGVRAGQVSEHVFAQRPQLRLGDRPLRLRRVGILHKRARQILMNLGVDLKLDQRIVQEGLRVMRVSRCVYEDEGEGGGRG